MSHYIHGCLRKRISDNIEYKNIVNPATMKIINQVPINDIISAKEAVESAQQSFKDWSTTAVHKRVDALIHWYCWLQDNKKQIAEIITEENGKPIDDALSEIARGIEVVQFSLSAPTYLKGEYASINTHLDIHTRKEALGVVAGIAPFNFPAMIPLWMVPLALACGNTFILKASELVPSCAVFLAEGAVKSGLPFGVFNVIQGGKDVVEYLCQEPIIKALTFVGSTRVGRIIEKQAIGKRIQLNMGAKNHAVLMPDADIDSASSSIIGAAFGGCGQRCMALSVVLTVGSATEFEKLLIEKANKLLPSINTGPLITGQSKKRIVEFIDEATLKGAEIITNNSECDGNYLRPTILKNVTTEMSVYQQELFGPVICLMKVETLNDAINTINENVYGNGCTIFTSETKNVDIFEKRIEVGQIGVNVPIPVPPPYFSWTSSKDSFTGSHHIYGKETFDFYTTTKTIMSKSINKTTINTVMPT